MPNAFYEKPILNSPYAKPSVERFCPEVDQTRWLPGPSLPVPLGDVGGIGAIGLNYELSLVNRIGTLVQRSALAGSATEVALPEEGQGYVIQLKSQNRKYDPNRSYCLEARSPLQ